MQPRFATLLARCARTLLFIAVAAISSSSAQVLGMEGGTMYYPSGLRKGQCKHAVGVTLAKPPDEVVEEFASVVTAPLLEYQFQYGMSEDFLLEARATTIFVSNHFAVGTKWVLGLSPFAFSIGSDVALWFGSLDIEGFDNTVVGWTWYPNATVGCDFGRFKVTVKLELNMLLRQTKSTGEITVQHAANLFNGGAITIYLEQPLWKNNYVALGIKSNFLRYYYVVWPGFPTFDRYSYIPEFYMGFIL